MLTDLASFPQKLIQEFQNFPDGSKISGENSLEQYNEYETTTTTLTITEV